MVSASGDGWIRVWDTHMFVCTQVGSSGGSSDFVDDGGAGDDDAVRRSVSWTTLT
jgi:hypothetical protein